MLAGIAGPATAGGEQNTAYIASWLKRLRDDRKLIVQAAVQDPDGRRPDPRDHVDEEEVPALATAA